MDCKPHLKDISHLALLAGCLVSMPLAAAEVARVGDAVITADALRETMAHHGYNLYEETSVHKALDEAIRFELLASEARRLGMDRDPELQRRANEWLVDKLLRSRASEFNVAAPPSDNELLAYYETHTNDFRRPSVVRGPVLTIFLREGKEGEARQKAADALREWKSGQPVESVLRKYAEDPGERVGGLQGSSFVEGQTSRRYPQAVADAMLGLQLRGEVAAPVETLRALYLVGLAERINGGLQPFAQVKRDIQRTIGQTQRAQADAAYCESLKQKASVMVNEAELKQVIQQLNASTRPPVGPGSPP